MFLLNHFNELTPMLNRKYVNELLKSNDRSQKYGLLLNTGQIKSIIEVRNSALQNYGRVELGFNTTRNLIESFCDSAFINSENYVPALNELQELFYYMKNETEDMLPDDELTSLIKDYFENVCGGSIELLKSSLETFAEDFKKRGDQNENRK